MVLTTDYVGVFCSPVSNEHLLAAHHFGLSRTDLLSLVHKAVDAILPSQDQKDKFRKVWMMSYHGRPSVLEVPTDTPTLDLSPREICDIWAPRAYRKWNREPDPVSHSLDQQGQSPSPNLHPADRSHNPGCKSVVGSNASDIQSPTLVCL